MSDRLFVFNPGDPDFERNSFRYNGQAFPLEPNGVTEIVSPWPEVPARVLLGACLEQLSRFGVIACGREASKVDIDAAEMVHEAYLRGVHGKTLTAWKADVDMAERAGMVPPAEPEKVRRARAKLAEWGALAGMVLLCLAGSTFGQPSTPQPRVVAALYDLDSTTEIFPALETLARDEEDRITTSSSSATVTAVAGTPFDEVSVNDQLLIRSAQAGRFTRTVITHASDTSIGVDSALNISTSAAFSWRKMNAGTAITDGWFEVGRRPVTIDIAFVQAVVTGGIDLRVQCATTAGDGTIRARQVYPALTPPAAGPTYTNFTSFPNGISVIIPDPWDRCRVGLKIGSSDDGDDATTNREQISINVEYGVI